MACRTKASPVLLRGRIQVETRAHVCWPVPGVIVHVLVLLRSLGLPCPQRHPPICRGSPGSEQVGGQSQLLGSQTPFDDVKARRPQASLSPSVSQGTDPP